MLTALIYDEFKPAEFFWRETRRRNIEDNAVTQNLRDGGENQQDLWWDGPVERVVDGERATQWKSQRDVPYPHEIRAELTAEVTVWGFRYLPRQDGSEEGMIREYEFYVSLDGVDWGKPVAKGVFEKGVREQFIRLDLFDGGFNTTRSKPGHFIRFLALSGYDNSGLAVVAGLDVLTEEISLPAG